MNYKQKIKKKNLLFLFRRADNSLLFTILRAALLQLAVGAFALLLARVEFSSGVFPFGLALIIGVPDTYSIAALVGYVVNNWIGDTIVGANSAYIGAVGVVAALRWILAGIQRGKYHKSNYVPCLVAGVSAVVITELIILTLTDTFSVDTVSRLVGGVALAGGFSYFYHTAFEAFKHRKSVFEMSGTQKASLALVLCTLLMSLYPVAIGPFSLGRIFGAGIVIFAAFLLSAPLDAAIFSAVAAAVALSEPSFIFAGVGICIGGVLAALFKKRGKALICLVYIVTAGIFTICAENYVYALIYISEVLFGALVFLVIPMKGVADARFEHLSQSLTSATSAIGIKLDSISGAMREITGLLDQTIPTKPDHRYMDELYSKAAEDICRRCAKVSACWVQQYGDTVDHLHRLTPVLLQENAVSVESFHELFRKKCIHLPLLATGINRHYTEYLDQKNRERNTDLYIGMLKKQFLAVSDMLNAAKGELCTYSNWDENRSKRIFDCALRLQLPVETAGCVYDSERRPIVTVSLRDLPPESLIKRLSAGISIIVGVAVGHPAVEESSGNTVLCFTERPAYVIKTASAQIYAEDKVCGDVFSIFTDLRGNVHMLLSDGMGTGAAAARDGAICCAFLKKLLESGFSIKRAAELANSALALRENAESASTLDALSFNVYEGGARLFKAGAAPTYCLRGNKILKFEGRSVPIGILNDVICKESQFAISDGDIIVMTSDGIQADGYRIIEESLKTSFGATPEELCREILRRTQESNHVRDDVTVMVAKVSKFSSAS